MFTVKLVIPITFGNETGWDFETEEEAEDFLTKMKFVKMGEVGEFKNLWRGSVVTRGAAKCTPLVSVEEME